MTTNSGALGVDRRDDRFELHLGQQLDRRVDEAEPLRAQRDLLGRFLAGHVERPCAPRRARRSACSSSVDLPMPGSPPSSTTPPGDEPAAQHAIELRRGRSRSARFSCGVDRRERRARPIASPATLAKARRRGRGDASRPACSTRRSAGTGPATSALAAAFGAAVDGLRLGHGQPDGTRQRARPAQLCATLGGRHQAARRDGDGGAELADDDAGGLVGDAHRVGERRAGGRAARRARRSPCRPRPRRRTPRAHAPGIVSAPCAVEEAHALLRARDQQRRRCRGRGAALAPCAARSRLVAPAADDLAKLAAIGRDQRRAAVPRPVVALRVDQHRLALRARARSIIVAMCASPPLP